MPSSIGAARKSLEHVSGTLNKLYQRSKLPVAVVTMPPKRNASAAAERAISPPSSKRTKTKAVSTVTSKAVKSFFTPASQKEAPKTSWSTVHDTVLVGRYEPSSNEKDGGAAQRPSKRRKIAAFDFDFTLISTSSGNVFGKSPSDWKWWDPCVPKKLRELHNDGYHLAIVSNQGGLNLASKEPGSGKVKRLNDFKTKVTAVLEQLDLPMTLYAASGRDVYRKPRAGIWSDLLDDFELREKDGEKAGDDENPILNAKDSFFVGDAAGRVKRGKIKADHSSSDRDFAENVGIAFYTPEEFFLGDYEMVEWKRALNPLDYIGEMIQAQVAIPERADNKSSKLARTSTKSEEQNSTQSADDGTFTFRKASPLEIVLLVGSPGAGKSTFYRTHLASQGYARVNQDTLKTRDRCLKAARRHLAEDKESVAVDNTNADTKTRAEWVALARELAVPIRCVWLQAPPEVCRHNDAVRSMNEGEVWNPEKRQGLPGMAFDAYKGRFQTPKREEGFVEVVEVPFRFSGTEEMRGVWSRYWV